MENWWIYLVVILAVIALYFLFTFILYLLMKRAQKKAFKLLDTILPYEKEKFDMIIKARNKLKEDGRFLPKNILEVIDKDEKLFLQIPVNIQEVKGQSDFIIMYLDKYLKEKKLIQKDDYKKMDDELNSYLYMNPEDKTSPYYQYNKKAMSYNAYLGMGALAVFSIRRKNQSAPIL